MGKQLMIEPGEKCRLITLSSGEYQIENCEVINMPRGQGDLLQVRLLQIDVVVAINPYSPIFVSLSKEVEKAGKSDEEVKF